MHSFSSLYNENTVISKEYPGPLDFDITEVDCIHTPNFSFQQADPADCTNFDPDYLSEEITFTPCNPEMMRAMDETEFEGFSFTSPIFSEIVNVPNL